MNMPSSMKKPTCLPTKVERSVFISLPPEGKWTTACTPIDLETHFKTGQFDSLTVSGSSPTLSALQRFTPYLVRLLTSEIQTLQLLGTSRSDISFEYALRVLHFHFAVSMAPHPRSSQPQPKLSICNFTDRVPDSSELRETSSLERHRGCCREFYIIPPSLTNSNVPAPTLIS